jgi:hypothetical protein
MTGAALPPLPLESLRGRGFDPLIEEYAVATNAVRRNELHQFLAGCLPIEGEPSPPDRRVRLAAWDDIRGTGRIVDEIPGSDIPVSVPGRDIPDIPLQLIDLRGATIYSNQIALIDGDLLVCEHIRHMTMNWFEVGRLRELFGLGALSNIDPVNRTAWLRPAADPVKLPDNRVYFMFHGVIGVVSFGHFIFDVLGQLILFDRLRERCGEALVPVFPRGNWSDFGHDGPFRWPGMVWLFERLVGPDTEVVQLQDRSAITIRQGFTTTRPVIFDQGLSVAALKYVHRRILDSVQPSPGSSSPERVYISRRDVNWREVDNLPAVEDILREFGFTFIAAGELTPQEIFDITHDARVIIGVHGSNLIYSMYMKQPGTIIELAHEGKDWRVLLSCAAAIGHDTMRVDSIGNDTDLDALRTCLSAVCGRVG